MRQRRPLWREYNFPLYIGAALVALSAVLAVLGPSVAPRHPLEQVPVLTVGTELLRAPFPPFTAPGFPLGSDNIGRDTLSRILWGIRPTLLLALSVVVVRLAIGVPLGLLAGWYRGAAERAVDALIGVAVVFPVLLVSLAVIAVLGHTRGLWPFLVGMAVTGWADLAGLVKNQSIVVGRAAYVDSARAVGVPSSRVIWRYILPQLWTVLPTLTAFELSAVILLAAELGFLGIYIGGGFVYGEPRGDSPGVYLVLTSGYPELGQLLSDIWSKLLLAPWDPMIVGSVVVLHIFAFNMLGEGLRRRLDITRSTPGRNNKRPSAARPSAVNLG